MTLKQITGKANHENGHSFESKILAKLKRTKPLCIIHADGSRGLFDILLQRKDKQWVGVVCRTNGYIPPEERNALYDYMKESPKTLIVMYYKVSQRKTKMITLRR